MPLLNLADLDQRLHALKALPIHRGRVLRAWLNGKALDAGPRHQPQENFLPLSVRNGLPALSEALDAVAQIHSQHPGADDSVRLLVKLADGQMIESVLLPRDGLCVSTQVGCAVGCRFCMTGKSGLIRQVSSLEIVAQVVLARRQRPVKKVVFMGMGEPAHNLDNVLEAIDLLGTEGGIGHKNLVFSTVGDRRVFELLPQQRVRPALAMSLHTTKADLREHLLPRAPKIAPQELMELGEEYARKTGYPIQYQWTLLKGINDGQDELDEILRLFKGKYALLNVIPFNSLEGSGLEAGNGVSYERPDAERIREIVKYLHSRYVLTKVRNSAGQDVDGGCGQLRARAEGAAQRVDMRRLRDTRTAPAAPVFKDVVRFHSPNLEPKMNIECRHCAGSWDVSGIVSDTSIAIFKECHPEVSAKSVRQLKEILGLPMMETKKLAAHVTTTKDMCFHCCAPLLLDAHFVKQCQRCGAINLDIYNA